MKPVMKSIYIEMRSGLPRLMEQATETPQPGPGELLIEVYATGVTPTELEWFPTLNTKDGAPRIAAVPGHEFSGVVAAVGPAVRDWAAGDEVFGMNDWFAQGATAEFCLTTPGSIARKPASLTHVQAASVPIGALTAWQGLLDRGKMKFGESVLIQGGAGSVGLYAVQLAARAGTHVTTTASEAKLEYVRQLGAESAIDYRSDYFARFQGAFDLIFDGVGGEVLARSWDLLRPQGRMVTIAADSERTADPRVKEAFFIVEPDSRQLHKIAGMIDAAELRVAVGAVVPMAAAEQVYLEKTGTRNAPGKIVIEIKPER